MQYGDRGNEPGDAPESLDQSGDQDGWADLAGDGDLGVESPPRSVQQGINDELRLTPITDEHIGLFKLTSVEDPVMLTAQGVDYATRELHGLDSDSVTPFSNVLGVPAGHALPMVDEQGRLVFWVGLRVDESGETLIPTEPPEGRDWRATARVTTSEYRTNLPVRESLPPGEGLEYQPTAVLLSTVTRREIGELDVESELRFSESELYGRTSSGVRKPGPLVANMLDSLAAKEFERFDRDQRPYVDSHLLQQIERILDADLEAHVKREVYGDERLLIQSLSYRQKDEPTSDDSAQAQERYQRFLNEFRANGYAEVESLERANVINGKVELMVRTPRLPELSMNRRPSRFETRTFVVSLDQNDYGRLVVEPAVELE